MRTGFVYRRVVLLVPRFRGATSVWGERSSQVSIHFPMLRVSLISDLEFTLGFSLTKLTST